MEIEKLKIDDDLSEFLKSKENHSEFINKCIREAKDKEPDNIECEKSLHQEVITKEKKSAEPVKEYSSVKYGKYIGIFFIAVIFCGFMIWVVSNSVLSSPDSFASVDSTAVEDSASSEKVQAKKTWEFSSDVDKMTNSKNVWAKLYSDNSISQEFPYGDTQALITVRHMKKYGNNVIISITDGQIFGNEYNNANYIMVKFDAAAPVKYWFDEPEDGSSESVFIRKSSSFIAKCKKAKHINVEIPLYQGGRPVFEFHVDKPLIWKK